MKQTNSISHFEKLHRYYEKKAYNQLIKDFRVIFKGIDFDDVSIPEEALQKTLLKVYIDTGLHYGKMVVKDIESEKKSAPYPLFSEAFQRFIKEYFGKDGLKKVTTISETIIKTITKVIQDANDLGLTQSQVTSLIKKTVNSPKFYRWQALRIARTESLFAMNASKQTAFEESSIVMDKVWIAGGSKHPRVDHQIMNGTKVNSNELFTLPNGEKCMFPGDTSLSAEQVINCSCSFSYTAKRDKNGNLIFK